MKKPTKKETPKMELLNEAKIINGTIKLLSF
jgi:hypothetical protein